MNPFSRRKFISSTFGLLTIAALPAAEARSRARTDQFTSNGRLPVLQGTTDARSATLVISHPKNIPLQFSVMDQKGRDVHSVIDDFFPVPGSTMAITQVTVHGLRPERDYFLNLFGIDGRVFDQRVFRSLDVHRPGVRFAVASCMNDRFAPRGRDVWDALIKEQPEFVIFLGDTVYADSEKSDRSEQQFGLRYAQTRNALSWFYMPRLIPTMATWDDHDYGVDNGDKSFSMAPATRRLFRKFWGDRFSETYQQGQGIGSVFNAFGQRFFLMDDRSFRDAKNDTRASHWGREQTDWLIAEIASSDSPCWLMNGNQYFGGYLRAESFQSNYPSDFNYLLEKLSCVNAPVCFVSGDVHFSEIKRIEPELLGYETFEYTSSGVHSFTFPGHQHLARNHRRVASEWRYNFLVFETAQSLSGWKINSRCVLSQNKTSFTHTAVIKR